MLLKDEAIQSFNFWSAVGKPRHGEAFNEMRIDKRRYKIAMKSK